LRKLQTDITGLEGFEGQDWQRKALVCQKDRLLKYTVEKLNFKGEDKDSSLLLKLD